MKRAEDLVGIKEKPYNSILPYIRAKQAEKVEAGKEPALIKNDSKDEIFTEG